MPQVFRGEGVPELMQKEVLAVWPFSAFVSVFGDTLTAIEASLLGNALVSPSLRYPISNGDHVSLTRLVKTPAVLGIAMYKNRTKVTDPSTTSFRAATLVNREREVLQAH